MLLARYGILFRDLLARESNAPRWRDLLNILRRLEARGEVRGGRFVSGFGGEQFALPEAVESLRAARTRESAARSSPSPPPTPEPRRHRRPRRPRPRRPGQRSPLPQRLHRRRSTHPAGKLADPASRTAYRQTRASSPVAARHSRSTRPSRANAILSHARQAAQSPASPLADAPGHRRARARKTSTWTGRYLVFTAAYHLKRGYCCNSGCRHCP